ncbi:hypothetical protein [Shewanella algae]|uniref:hypothetical protein n=1 Tax=Shewanella algae TaxID=38313 RepID=UPI001182DF4E|nr:hypothetical protein [Shewanella algae]
MKRVKVVLVSLLFSGAGMAYDLHIEDSGKTIEQWAAFVESSPFLSASPSAEARNPATGEVISINTPNAGEYGRIWTPCVNAGEYGHPALMAR